MTHAAGGEEAIEKICGADGNSFELLLVDANMPGLDGFSLIERIQKRAVPNPPAIMMLTSSGQRGDALRCRQLGIAAYLVKPIIRAQLRDAILIVLGTKIGATRDQAQLVTRHSLMEARRSLNVLLAEDNAINQRLASRLIEKRGHRVSIAANGREVLHALEKEQFDVIIMDVSMPKMDGFEATKAIRAKEHATGLHIPINAVTANAMKGDREKCLSAGKDGYVSKPIRPRELFEMIGAVLEVPA